MTQYTLTHHMVNKPFLLLGLAAEYWSRRCQRWCDKHCGPPSDVMTLTRELSWQRLRRLLLKKRKKTLFEPPFRALRGNICTPSMTHWKAHGRLYIRRNWTFFATSYGWDVVSGNRSKSAFFEGGGSVWVQISEGKGHRPPTTVGVRVAEWLPFRVVSKYPQCII